jgi:hypothetical protein
MSDDLQDIVVPAASAVLTADQAFHGHHIPPQQQVLLYSDSEWEGFVQEWAHYCLKTLYAQVQRFAGSGDRGIDIAGFADADKLQGVWDNYQCKHYDHALYPSDAWPEIGKLLWHTFNQQFTVPHRYYFVAPLGVGTSLNGYLSNAPDLKKALIDGWDKNCKTKITTTKESAGAQKRDTRAQIGALSQVFASRHHSNLPLAAGACRDASPRAQCVGLYLAIAGDKGAIPLLMTPRRKTHRSLCWP